MSNVIVIVCCINKKKTQKQQITFHKPVSEMVICKFYLQGTCRFGSSCKFEHTNPSQDHNYGSGTSVLLQNYGNKPPQTSTNVDTATLIKSVINDMLLAEKGGQWQLSSYAPFKDKPAFPGFEDHSMEEIRFGFYEAAKSATIDQYKQNLQMTLQQAIMRFKALQNPSPEAINILSQIYNTNTPQPSIFSANPAQNTSIFGPQNAFANQNSIFGATKPPAQPAFAPPQSIFGGQPPQTSIFGQTSAAFGATAPNQSIFGGNKATSAPPLTYFDGGPPAYTYQQNAAPAPIPNPSPLGFGAQQPPFGGNAMQQGNIFQQQQPAPAVVSQTQGGNAFQHSANIFGNLGAASQPKESGFAAPASQLHPEYYSKLEDLTEEEIKWFQSEDFDIAKIPEKPPTYEMCFKT